MLKYTVERDDNPVTVAVDTRLVNDGSWHNVTIIVAGIVYEYQCYVIVFKNVRYALFYKNFHECDKERY